MWLPVLIVACVALWIALVALLRRVTGRSGGPSVLSLRTAARVTAIFSIFFAVVSLVVSVPTAAGNLSLEARPIAATDDPSSPEIVVLLLDGYPRSDVLADGFGFDNTDFEAALTEMGFDIKDESRSNYSATWPSIASMMNGAYLDEIPILQPFPADQTEQYQVLSQAIDTSTLPELLRANGYEVAWVPGPFEDVALNTADRLISGGQVTAFELSLLRHSPLLPGCPCRRARCPARTASRPDRACLRPGSAPCHRRRHSNVCAGSRRQSSPADHVRASTAV